MAETLHKAAEQRITARKASGSGYTLAHIQQAMTALGDRRGIANYLLLAQ